MPDKQFGVEYGRPLKHDDKTTCIRNLQIEIDRLGGVPYGWMRVFETLLFGFYNPRNGHCSPSHSAIAQKARCGTRTVQRALSWARENNLIHWAHGIVRDGWRVVRTSNRYAFATFLSVRQIVASIASTDRQKSRGNPTSNISSRTLTEIAAEVRDTQAARSPLGTQRNIEARAKLEDYQYRPNLPSPEVCQRGSPCDESDDMSQVNISSSGTLHMSTSCIILAVVGQKGGTGKNDNGHWPCGCCCQNRADSSHH